MIFHFGVILYTGLFFGFLAFLAERPIVPEWSWYILATLPLMTLSFFAVKRLTGRLLGVFLPLVLATSTPLLFSLIDREIEKRIFIVASAGVYYLALLATYRLQSAPEDRTARAMQNTTAFSALFLLLAAADGFYLNFAVPLWLLLLVFFLAVFAVSFQTLLGAARERRRIVFVTSVILGSLFAELAWIAHFWPFGYLTTASLLLVLYYWIWRVAYDTLRDRFLARSFVIESAVLLALLMLLLISSPWRIAV